MPIKVNNFFENRKKAENDEKQTPLGGIGSTIHSDEVLDNKEQCPVVIEIKVDADPYVQFLLTRFNSIEVNDATMATAGRSKNRSNGYYK